MMLRGANNAAGYVNIGRRSSDGNSDQMAQAVQSIATCRFGNEASYIMSAAGPVNKIGQGLSSRGGMSKKASPTSQMSRSPQVRTRAQSRSRDS